MTQTVFVTGTGTDVGKTIFCAALVHGLARLGEKPRYWKPVQTGDVSDTEQVRTLQTLPLTTLPPAAHFPAPASPDQAARQAGEKAPTIHLLENFWHQHQAAGITVIEGAGGVKVPLNDAGETWIDFIQKLRCPVVVVAHSGLGTLNHTSLTLDALKLAGAPIAGVFLQGDRHEANEQSLKRLYPDVAIYSLPRLEQLNKDARWHGVSEAAAASVREFLNQPKTNWSEWDQKHCWHPFTQHKKAATPLKIAQAKGPWLITEDGEKLFDATSSWWVNTIGHGREEIGEAIARQQRNLDHCIFANATHEPASTLAKKMVDKTGGKLSRVFYTDNGSCAVEVALKMAAQYWVNQGIKNKNLFLSFQGSYHGDTFGTMAAAHSSPMHQTFAPFFYKTLHHAPVTTHPSIFCPEGASALERNLRELDQLLDRHQNELAAVIIEPMLQGAGGMLVQELGFLRHLRAKTKELGIPLVYDEVFTGMGRCGDYFTFNRFSGIDPDIACVAKGLTGGNMPLAITLAKEEIFQAFWSDDARHALLHGHSYTANPLGCAAALATMAIYERENLTRRAMDIEARFKQWVHGEGERLGLSQPRVFGAMLAFELPGTGLNEYFNPKASLVPAMGQRHGLLLRPLGNTVYLVPPLAVQQEDLEELLSRLTQTITDIV